MKDENRTTGRTFRIVMQGILKASEGDNVIIVCFNESYTKDLFRASLRIMYGYSTNLVLSENVLTPLKLVKIGKTGSLRFMSRRDYFDSRYNWSKNHTISFDHYQGEQQ